MKSKWLAVGLGITLFLGSVLTGVFSESGRRYRDYRTFITTVITKNFTAASANYELLDEVIGTQYVIDCIIFSGLTASHFYFNDSGTTNERSYGPYYTPANGTVIDRDMNIKLAKSCGFYVSVGGASDITVEYHLAETP